MLSRPLHLVVFTTTSGRERLDNLQLAKQPCRARPGQQFGPRRARWPASQLASAGDDLTEKVTNADEKQQHRSTNERKDPILQIVVYCRRCTRLQSDWKERYSDIRNAFTLIDRH
ncbi:hypothetical protein JTB14_017293 [Gonioctena quinquepunctata]|nr:hypothetical protein JTB14_017293 [Gonioctena quinquepunctata]